jgi:hypothetical protein
MRKRILFAVAGSALFIAGLVVGIAANAGLPVFAAANHSTTTQATTNGNYCQLYINTLAKDLKVDAATLEKANQDAATQVINRMAADGKISASQKAQMLSRLQQAAANPCAALAAMHGPGMGKGHLPGLAERPQMQAMRQQVESAVAKALNLTASQLDTDLASGQTIAQIAQKQGVQLSAVKSAYLQAVQNELNQAVQSGMLTQAQSQMIYNQLQMAVQNGFFPMLERGGPGMVPQPMQG